MNFKKLTIKCLSGNGDAVGTWLKADVEEEMRDIGMTDYSWIEYIVQRALGDYAGYDDAIADALKCDSVVEMKLNLNGLTMIVRKS